MMKKAIEIQNALERTIAEHMSIQKLLPSAIRKVAKNRDLVLSELENSTVHGGALATLTRISLSDSTIDGAAVPPAYGCEIAVNYATSSLSMLVAEVCAAMESADLLAMSAVVHKHANGTRESIAETLKKIAGKTPRSKILMRKAAGRRTRTKLRRTSLKTSDRD